jgi:dihydrofolate reductase
MRTLCSFIVSTVDGFYAGPNDEFDRPNVGNEEFTKFSLDQLDNIDVILFGRRTYEMMAGFWPTPEAKEQDPETADRMNTASKIVFSNTLEKVGWNNTRLVKGDIAAEVRRLKQQPGKDLAIFGSQNLTANLMHMGLLDELRLMIHPVALGQGKSLFHTMDGRVKLKLLQTRTFSSGNVLLTYQPQTGDRAA